jgi:hypothetical protein
LAKINDFVPISNQLSIKATYAEFFTQTEWMRVTNMKEDY